MYVCVYEYVCKANVSGATITVKSQQRQSTVATVRQ